MNQNFFSTRDYEIKDLNENLRNNNFATFKYFHWPKIKALNLALCGQPLRMSHLSILDSYPVLPSPESNISLSSWYGKDRSNGSRKFSFIKIGVLAFDFSISSNLYENIILIQKTVFLKILHKKPTFFIQTKNKNLNLFAKGTIVLVRFHGAHSRSRIYRW